MGIALLTDFGLRDPYVAAMKGVIASRSDARVDDLTHDIAPFDVFGAAWFLRSVVAYWPRSTIFVAVVDPGVGTDRRIIAAQHDEKIFLAPDNGLLSLVVSDPVRAVSVENEKFFLPRGSTTFHGRDRFAPVAAAIANGTPLEELGPPVERIERLDYRPPRYECARATGTIVAIDRFGNLITDIEPARLPFQRFAVEVRGVKITGFQHTYSQWSAAAPGGAFMIAGSLGTIEISMSSASAADTLQLRRLDEVVVILE